MIPRSIGFENRCSQKQGRFFIAIFEEKKKGLEYDELHPWLLPFRTYFSCPFNDQMPSLHYDVYYVYFLRVVHNKMIGVK